MILIGAELGHHCGQMFSSAAAMHDEGTGAFVVVPLSAGDVDDIHALYMLSRSATPHGFLAIRTKNDFYEIFARPEDVIGTGIRCTGRLIAYSICHRLAKNPYPIKPVLSLIDATTSTVFHGDGTVVDPAFQGRAIARRMFRLRRQQIREQHIDHVLGLIAVDNIVSIGNATLAGVVLAGLARDETSLNYIAYAGRFGHNLQTDTNTISVKWKNHEQQRLLFSEGYIAYGLTSSNATNSAAAAAGPERQLGFIPWTVLGDERSADGPQFHLSRNLKPTT